MVAKIIKSFPLSNQLLKDVVVIDPKQRRDIPADAVVRIASALPQINIEDLDDLKDEYIEFQLEDEEDLPQCEAIDRFWGALSKTTTGGRTKFPNICRLVKGILCIPHSNASSERL